MQCQSNDVYAGFFVRTTAFLIDIMVVGILSFGVNMIGNIFILFDNKCVLNRYMLFNITLMAIILYICKVAYFIITTHLASATLGKRIMKLRVISCEEGKEKPSLWDIIYRETIGRFLSGILEIGYIMVGVTEQKTAIHDMLADTRVVYYNQMVIHKKIIKTVITKTVNRPEKDNIMHIENGKTDTPSVVYKLPSSAEDKENKKNKEPDKEIKIKDNVISLKKITDNDKKEEIEILDNKENILEEEKIENETLEKNIVTHDSINEINKKDD